MRTQPRTDLAIKATAYYSIIPNSPDVHYNQHRVYADGSSQVDRIRMSPAAIKAEAAFYKECYDEIQADNAFIESCIKLRTEELQHAGR